MIQTRTLSLYTPHSAQLAIHNSTARYRVAAYGRQSGKSTCSLNELAFKAWNNPSHTYWFVSPTFEQARTQYRRLVGMLMTCPQVMLKKNQTELRIKLINQSVIGFKSGEVGNNLRGETLNGVVIDEVRDQPTDLWSLVIRPMLATTQGWALFVSTPNGFDGFYDLYDRTKTENGWAGFHAPSTANPLFTQDEYDAARQSMGPDEFAQEILAEFREFGVGKVYTNHSLDNQKVQNPFCIQGQKWSPYIPIVVGLDFNVGMMCWELGQFKGRDCYFGDEIAMQNTNTQEAALALASKVAGHQPGVILVGDASGKARKTSASGETDYSIILQVLRNAGVYVVNKTPEINPPVKDRVNIVNAMLKDATGGRHFFYHPLLCPKLKRDFERVTWKQGSADAVFDKSDSLLTHPSDAAGYPVFHYANEFRTRPGRMMVLSR